MSTTSIDIAYRPCRIGFLVRRGSLQDVLSAARLNAFIWGGMTNPILPIDDDLERSRKLVSDFKVDLLYQIVEGDRQLTAVVEAFPFLEAPSDIRMHGLLELVGDDEFSVVDVRLLVSHYYSTIIQQGGGQARTVMPSWSANDQLAPLYAVVFGDYGEDAPAPRYRRAFHALRAEEVQIEARVPTQVLGRVTPILLTADRLGRPPSWLDGHGILLGDPMDPDTLAGFWNLRSIGLRVAFWPLPDGGTFRAYCVEHLRRVTPNPREERERPGPDFWRLEWPATDADIPVELRAVLEEVGARPTLAQINDRTWSQPTRQPAVWSTRSRSVLATVEDDRWGRSRMVLSLPDHPYSGAEARHYFSHWLVDVSALSEYDTPGYTVRIPSLPDLNPLGFRSSRSHRLCPTQRRFGRNLQTAS
jgi:hypothetical protein